MTTYKVLFIAPDGNKYVINIDGSQSAVDAAREAGLNLPESSLLSWCFSDPVEKSSTEDNNSLNYIDSLLNLPDEDQFYSKELKTARKANYGKRILG